MKSWPELIGSGNPEAHNYGGFILSKEQSAAVPSLHKHVALCVVIGAVTIWIAFGVWWLS